MNTTELIAQGQALLAAATPIPWRAGVTTDHLVSGRRLHTTVGPAHESGNDTKSWNAAAAAAIRDAGLVDFAVNNLPVFCNAIRAQQDEIEVLRAKLAVAITEDERWSHENRDVYLRLVSAEARAMTAERRADEAEACAHDEVNRRIELSHDLHIRLELAEAGAAAMREAANSVLMKYGTGLGAYGDLERVLAASNTGTSFLTRLDAAELGLEQVKDLVDVTTERAMKAERAQYVAEAERDALLQEKQTPAANREHLGRIVRASWIAWAKQQPNPKPSWLVPWEGLDEPDREVDRRIGEEVTWPLRVAHPVVLEELRVTTQERDALRDERDELVGLRTLMVTRVQEIQDLRAEVERLRPNPPPGGYCDDCPVRDIGPFDRKQWSK